MAGLGMGELIVILLIVVMVFGASRLPQIGEGLGKGIQALKRGLKSDDDIDVTGADKRVGPTSSAESASNASRGVSDAEVVERKS
jgi:sec-independent protein translocase protein TatA